MIDQFEHAQAEGWLAPPEGARNPTKQYIADHALEWWMRFGYGPERTDRFIGFADVLYRLAGFEMRSPTIRGQLTSAVKRHAPKADGQ